MGLPWWQTATIPPEESDGATPILHLKPYILYYIENIGLNQPKFEGQKGHPWWQKGASPFQELESG